MFFSARPEKLDRRKRFWTWYFNCFGPFWGTTHRSPIWPIRLRCQDGGQHVSRALPRLPEGADFRDKKRRFDRLWGWFFFVSFCSGAPIWLVLRDHQNGNDHYGGSTNKRYTLFHSKAFFDALRISVNKPLAKTPPPIPRAFPKTV